MADFRKWWALALVVLLAVPLGAQGPLVPGTPDRELRYEAIHTVSSSTGEAVTVQQPASPSASVQFELAVVYCSVACTATLSQNGTGATSTTLATKALNGAPTSSATAWSASNVSGGTTLNVYNIAAGVTLTLDLTKFFLGKGNGVNQNLTITTSGMSGSDSTMIQWVEK